MAKSEATIDIGGNSYQFEQLHGTLGPDVINIAPLYKQTDVFTYDPGFTSTASCESQITFIDGDKGVLLHRDTRSSSSPNTAIFWKPAICFCTASCRQKPKSRTLTIV